MTQKYREGTFDRECNLLNMVIAALRRTNLPEIEQATGISYVWLWKLTNGDIKHPSINRVVAIYEYLAKEKLAIKDLLKQEA